MTAKRFYYAHGIIFDTHKDNHVNKIGTIKDLDTGLRIVDWLNALHEEKEMWKRECKRLKGLSYLENEKVELEDIIGLVKTDEPTNSVELKKELYK